MNSKAFIVIILILIITYFIFSWTGFWIVLGIFLTISFIVSSRTLILHKQQKDFFQRLKNESGIDEDSPYWSDLNLSSDGRKKILEDADRKKEKEKEINQLENRIKELKKDE